MLGGTSSPNICFHNIFLQYPADISKFSFLRASCTLLENFFTTSCRHRGLIIITFKPCFIISSPLLRDLLLMPQAAYPYYTIIIYSRVMIQRHISQNFSHTFVKSAKLSVHSLFYTPKRPKSRKRREPVSFGLYYLLPVHIELIAVGNDI